MANYLALGGAGTPQYYALQCMFHGLFLTKFCDSLPCPLQMHFYLLVSLVGHLDSVAAHQLVHYVLFIRSEIPNLH